MREAGVAAPSEKQMATASTAASAALVQKVKTCGSTHQSAPLSAGVIGAAFAAGTRKEAVAGDRLGTSATNVPNTITTKPNQIQPTSGLRIALMMGWSVSGFIPSYTT